MTAGARVDLTRRPPASFLAWTGLVGVALGVGSGLLIHGLMADPTWWVALPVGLAVGALVPLSVAGGSRVVIADGVLTYFLRGLPCVTCRVADIQGVEVISAGQLAGVGLRLAPSQLTFVSRKGVTLRTCEAHYAATGCALVLEFLRPADADLLRQALVPAPDAGG